MTALGWLAAGGIFLFAVSGHPAFINLQLAGLILLARGAIGVWMSIGRERRTRYRDSLVAAALRATRAADAITRHIASDDGIRVPLADLLAQPGSPKGEQTP